MSIDHESEISTSTPSATSPTTATISGTVKWFDVKKGFGFIVGPAGEDVFVHFSVIETDGFRTLKDGEEVNYELHTGLKGLHAQHVRRTRPAEEPPKLKATIHAKSRPAERSRSDRAPDRKPEPVAASADSARGDVALSGTIAADAMGKRRAGVDGYVG